MKVTLDIPDDVFWAAAARAEQFDQRVDTYAVDLLITAVATRLPSDSDPVLRLWRGAFSDAEIGAQLNLTNAQVSARRRRYGLPANRKRRGGGFPVSVARTRQSTPHGANERAAS